MSGQLRPLQKRDIAILCRTNEGAAAVAEALQERGLPVTLGTSGLLSTPEARLTMACLRRMADPDDTLATAEIIALETGHPAGTMAGRSLELFSCSSGR